MTIDHEAERKKDVDTILDSDHPHKVVVAGPGTGKSFLFQEAIEKEKKLGKKRFLAITFMGKLGDALADDLAGLAETMTLHGFARRFVLESCPKGWEYYPEIKEIIEEDLALKGIKNSKVGDIDYEKRTKYYKAVGHADVMHYAIQICKKDKTKIPKYDLILVDEFQDFDEIESEFIDLLATENKVLIVGDDDQALYEFKGSSPKFIREKFADTNTDFQSHTLRFCSRCTEVIIDAFHGIINHFGLSSGQNSRIKKEYICYIPDKKKDSDLNPQIIVHKDAKPGMIPIKIKEELENMLEQQKIKEVLIIAEGRSCKSMLEAIAKKMDSLGFRNVNYFNHNEIFYLKNDLISGYKILAKGHNPVIAWRLIISEMKKGERKKVILSTYDDSGTFADVIPEDFKKLHEKNSQVLDKILNSPKSVINGIADSSISKLKEAISAGKKEDREILANQLIAENKNLPRPLVNINITVCNILGSKGLGADVVFLVGFDQGKLPLKTKAEDSEIYQMLVALTRAKKRIYFINTIGSQVSQFLDAIDKKLYTIA